MNGLSSINGIKNNFAASKSKNMRTETADLNYTQFAILEQVKRIVGKNVKVDEGVTGKNGLTVQVTGFINGDFLLSKSVLERMSEDEEYKKKILMEIMEKVNNQSKNGNATQEYNNPVFIPNNIQLMVQNRLNFSTK